MDRIAEDLLDVATHTGEFGTAFDKKVEELKSRYFDFEVGIYSDNYFNTSAKRVQLGDLMVVTITVNYDVAGMGISIPLELTNIAAQAPIFSYGVKPPGIFQNDFLGIF